MEKRNIIAIVNGYPRSGKDTVVMYLGLRLFQHVWQCTSMSSVDKVKGFTSFLGIEEEPKTPEKRAMWAEIKDAVEKYDRLLSRDCIANGIAFSKSSDRTIFFIHAREPEAINFMETIIPEGFEFMKIFVDRPDAEGVYSNSADQNVEGVDYHVVIKNQAGLSELEQSCNAFADFINKGEYPR